MEFRFTSVEFHVGGDLHLGGNLKLAHALPTFSLAWAGQVGKLHQRMHRFIRTNLICSATDNYQRMCRSTWAYHVSHESRTSDGTMTVGCLQPAYADRQKHMGVKGTRADTFRMESRRESTQE